MVKSMAIYQNVTNFDAFVKYIHDNICSRLLKFPGVISMHITKVFEMNAKAKQNIHGVQIIIDTYYESTEVIDRVYNTSQGKEILYQIINVPSGDLSIFIGQEQQLTAKCLSKNHIENIFD